MRRILPAALVAVLSLSLVACADDSKDSTDEKGKPEGSSLTTAQKELVAKAGSQYADYVRTETAALLSGTEAFVTAYKAGDDDKARALYAPTRMHWEAIEPVAESFGDLDPRTDAREADLEAGQEWTGWHLLEKDLWQQDAEAGYEPLSPADRAKYADQLLADLQELEGQVADATYTGEQIANGAKELLDEVANGKITGEEEIWSHTDLYDFQANVDGARKSFDVLQPVLTQTNPKLEAEIAASFASLQAMLDTVRKGNGFVSYDLVPEGQRKTFSDAVNALAEPLAQLSAAVA